VDNVANRGVVPMMCNADLVELKGEVKKIHKHLTQLIDSKKQSNLVFGFFVV
jgi:hypothetical protein